MSLRLCYGGTFDPFHLGHQAIALAAHEALQAPLWLIPAADPPHRAAPGASAEQRLTMLQLAVAELPGLQIDDRELRRAAATGRPSWTVDTLRELRAELGPQTPLVWLLGADSFASLPSWHHWQEMLELTHLLVAARPGTSIEQGLPAELDAALAGRWCDQVQPLQTSPAGRVLALQQPLYEVSASEVRRRMATGDNWRELLPPAVADYLQQHRLYRL